MLPMRMRMESVRLPPSCCSVHLESECYKSVLLGTFVGGGVRASVLHACAMQH
jgi:hypothetical protein